ncbi:RNA-binding protein 34-like [Branchiostoma lanceolatum]|uniref:RNA-binding protein 34-like n=1 Tax=Branchiostoma lanceolatum TaxID=7740 RepID=UPI00345410AD
MESSKNKSAGLFLDGYTVGGVANFLAKEKTPNSPAKKKQKKESVASATADLSALFSPRSPFISTPGFGSNDNSNSARRQDKGKAEESAISPKKNIKGEKKISIKEDSNNTEKSPQITTTTAATTIASNTQSQGSKKGKRKNKSLMPAEEQPVKKSSHDGVPVVHEAPPVNTTMLPKNKKKKKKRKSSENTQEPTEQVTLEDTDQVQVSENYEPPKKKRKRKKKKTDAKTAVPAADTQDSEDPSEETAGTVNVQDSKNTAKGSQVSQKPNTQNTKKDLQTKDEPPRKKKKHDSKILSERESLLKNADQAEQTRKEQVKKKQEEKKKMMTVTELEDANPTPGKRLRDPERDHRTVFVGNLPVSTTKKELKKMFRKFGEIESVRFRSIAQSNPNVSKRVAMMRQEIQEKKRNMNCYVVFTEKASAQAALKRNGTIVGGSHHIRVDLASNSQKFDHKLSIFVGNLPFDVEDDSVYEHFSQCGEVEGVRIIRDSKSGLGKGFGYVLFQDSASVGLAIRLNEKPFAGRKIRVKRAVKKEKVKNTSLGLGSASKSDKPFLKGKFSQKSDQGFKSPRKDKFKPKDKAMGFKKKQGGKKERWRNKPGFKGGLKSRGK